MDLLVKSQLQDNVALSSQKQKIAVQNFFIQKQNVNRKSRNWIPEYPVKTNSQYLKAKYILFIKSKIQRSDSLQNST